MKPSIKSLGKDQNNFKLSKWDVFIGCHNGSILGPLLLNIFLCHLFFTMNNFASSSSANYNTPYGKDDNAVAVILKLQTASKKYFKCSLTVK